MVFSPDNGQFIDNSWFMHNNSIASISGFGSTSGRTRSVRIKAKSGGTTTLRSPIYRIPLPDDQGGDKTCQVVIEVKVSKIVFDMQGLKMKIQNLNLVAGEDRVKCAVKLFDSTTESVVSVNLCDLLTPDSDKENVIFNLPLPLLNA